MIWEMAGDYDWYPAMNGGKGQYYMGNVLTTDLYNKFKAASPYGNTRASSSLPATTANIAVTLGSFGMGDDNYPMVATLSVVNNSASALPAGSVIEFDYPVSTPTDLSDSKSLLVTSVKGYNGQNNVGGFTADFNHAKLTLSASLAAGKTLTTKLTYGLPMAGPSNFIVTVNGKAYSLPQEYPTLPVGLK